MTTIAFVTVSACVALFLYTYLGYPLALWVMGRFRREPPVTNVDGDDWPTVSLTVPAYNEESQIRDLLESLLSIDYPEDKLQILVVSDASTDATDDIVRGYAPRVELLRMPDRGGKTKAENAAARHLTGEVIVNTDASIRIAPDALKPLVSVFHDPAIGCASGRDVSVGADLDTGNTGESGYVGYEMMIRDLETKVSGIIGASGCFYAIRPELHRLPLPESLSRDFAAALHTREHGYRAVSVASARCFVPRTPSLRKEFHRKVRTITRGMETLWHKRALLNPSRTGVFAWMLLSHKVLRWLLPWAGVLAFVGIGVLAISNATARFVFVLCLLVLLLAAAGWTLSDRPWSPQALSVPAYLVAGNIAAMYALVRALRGHEDRLWEPTRRESLSSRFRG